MFVSEAWALHSDSERGKAGKPEKKRKGMIGIVKNKGRELMGAGEFLVASHLRYT